MADQSDVELHIEIVRARNDWWREQHQAQVRIKISEIDEQRAMLRRCDQSLMRERDRLAAELPQQEQPTPMPRAVTQGPRQQPPLPEHPRVRGDQESLRPKVANAE
jgi:hypothetical protein